MYRVFILSIMTICMAAWACRQDNSPAMRDVTPPAEANTPPMATGGQPGTSPSTPGTAPAQTPAQDPAQQPTREPDQAPADKPDQEPSQEPNPIIIPSPAECEQRGGTFRPSTGGQVACPPGQKMLGQVRFGIEGGVCCR